MIRRDFFKSFAIAMIKPTVIANACAGSYKTSEGIINVLRNNPPPPGEYNAFIDAVFISKDGIDYTLFICDGHKRYSVYDKIKFVAQNKNKEKL